MQVPKSGNPKVTSAHRWQKISLHSWHLRSFPPQARQRMPSLEIVERTVTRGSVRVGAIGPRRSASLMVWIRFGEKGAAKRCLDFLGDAD